MSSLNITSVTEHFCNLAHLTSEEAKIYLPTIRSAQAYFDRLFMREPANADETALCEYACACKAFFDYTILKAATSKTYSTQSGGVFAKISEDEIVVNAEHLMQNAFAALPEGIIRDDGFVFEGVNI